MFFFSFVCNCDVKHHRSGSINKFQEWLRLGLQWNYPTLTLVMSSSKGPATWLMQGLRPLFNIFQNVYEYKTIIILIFNPVTLVSMKNLLMSEYKPFF